MSMAMMVAMASRNRKNDVGNDSRMEENRGAYSRMDGGEMNYSRMDGDMEMRRRRDSRGRFMGGNDDRRMGNDHSTHMGGYDRMEGNYSRMVDEPEMRRRRDSRGRYMEDEEGQRMAYDGNRSEMRRWNEPHIPPYLDRPGMETPSRMRDHNVVSFRDYKDQRRLIGFGANEGEEADMRQYGRRYDPNRMHMHGGERREMDQGYAEDGEDGKLTREEAEKWVEGMKSEDGKKGARWTYDQVKQYASNFGVQGDEVVEFFAVMNALATDYGKVARKHGVDKIDFWADLAKAFMHDKDAVPDKVRIYYECIAKRDDD